MNRRLMSAIVAIAILLSSFTATFAETGQESYKDVSGHWAAEAIYKWSDYGVIKGNNGLFKPNASITRGELACILNNMMGYKITAKNTFSDVKEGQYYTDAVLKAKAAGIINGDGEESLRPTDKITREEAAVMLAKAFAISDGSIDNSKFVDSKSVSSWARASVFGMEAKGYVRGSNGKYNPKSNITRAETVAIINNIVKGYYSKAGTYTGNVAGTAVIKSSDVVLNDVAISENLIIAEGVGQGDVSLNSVSVKGNTVVRGGGENSIHINGKSNIASVRIEKAGDKLRIVVDDGNTIDVEIAKGEEIIITGWVRKLDISASDAVINVIDADISKVSVTGNNAKLNVDKESKLGPVSINNTADNTAIKTEKGAVVGTVTAAAKTDISGDGTVEKVVLNEGANNSVVLTPNTQITAAKGVTGATAGGGAVIVAGSTTTNSSTGNSTTPGTTNPGTTNPGTTNPETTNPGTNPGSNVVAPTNITVSPTELTLEVGGEAKNILATIAPSDTTNKGITWLSSDTNIVTVYNGVVTPVSAGTATITAISVANGNLKATTTVTVAEVPTIDFLPNISAGFTANKNKLTFTVKGSLTKDIDTSKLKYMTAESGGNSINLAGTYSKVGFTATPAAGEYYYLNSGDETIVYITLTDSDAAAIKNLTGYGDDVGTTINENSDRLVAEQDWYPNAKVGTKAVSIKNNITVTNESIYEITSIHVYDRDNNEIGSSGTKPGYGPDSVFNVSVGQAAAKIVFCTGTYTPNVAVTDGYIKTVAINDDVINVGITIDDRNWEPVNPTPGTDPGTNPETDTTAPVFADTYPKTANVGEKSFDILVKANEAATFYYVGYVEAAARTAPNADQVIAGTDGMGASNSLSSGNSGTIQGNVEGTLKIENLQGSTNYDVFIVAVDVSNNKSNVIKISVKTSSIVVAPSNITVNPTEMTLKVGGEAKTILATITPLDTTNKGITWLSSDTDVVTVDNGVVTPISAGTATITVVSDANGNLKATTTVTVTEEPTASIDFLPNYMAGFTANKNKLTFTVKGSLTKDIDTSKLKYMTAESGGNSINLAGTYSKVGFTATPAAGEYYYLNSGDETIVYITLTDSDAAAIKNLTGYGDDVGTTINENSDRLVAEQDWYPNAKVGTKAVSIKNNITVTNESIYEITSIHVYDRDNNEIGSSGTKPGYGPDSVFNVSVGQAAAKIVFCTGTYTPNVAVTDGYIKTVAINDDVVNVGITIDNSNWESVSPTSEN